MKTVNGNQSHHAQLTEDMAPIFRIVEHTIAGQHIREYAGATRYDQEDVLKLNVKQYIPMSTQDRVPPNALTLIGAHGIGFPKVWETLLSNDNVVPLELTRSGDIRTAMG